MKKEVWRWGLLGILVGAIVVAAGYGIWRLVGKSPQVARIVEEVCTPGEEDERSCSCSSGNGTQSRTCRSDGNSWGGWSACSCSGGGGGGGDGGGGNCREGSACNKTINGVSCSGKKQCVSNSEFECVLDNPSCGAAPAKQCKTNADCAKVGKGAICDTQGRCMDPGGPVGCGSASDGSCNGTVVREPGGSAYCDAQGRRCSQVRVECKASNGDHCFIRSEEQCGAPDSCGSTTKTPRPSPSPSTPPQIVLACTGLTSSLAEPKIGQTVNLTCAGSVTPVGAVNLTYQFRYRINQGSWQSLTAVGAKANLEIAACGTYAAQCRTCGMVAGTKQCSPVWAGATN